MSDFCTQVESIITKVIDLKSTPEAFIQLYEAIQKIKQNLFEKGNSIFAENCITELLKYVLKIHMLEEDFPEGYSCFVRSIICFTEIFSINERVNFAKSLIECIKKSNDFSSNDLVILPTRTGNISNQKEVRFKEFSQTQAHVKLYFSILENIIMLCTKMYDGFINDMLVLIQNPITRKLAIRAFSFYIPLSEPEKIMTIRLIFIFVFRYFNDGSGNIKLYDEYAAKILKMCVSMMEKQTRSLIGRDLVSYIRPLELISGIAPVFLEEFFGELYKFVSDDHSNHKLIISVMEQTFNSFHSIGSYRKIWKVLLQFNTQYYQCIKRIENNGNCNQLLIPSLAEIDPTFKPSFANIKDFPSNVFFEVAATQEKLQPIQRAHLRNFLKNEPPLNLILDLFNIAPDEVLEALPNYRPEYAIEIFGQNKNLLLDKMDIAQQIIEKNISIPFISLIAIVKHENDQEIETDIIDEIKAGVTNKENYAYPYFIEALATLFPEDEVFKVINKNFIKTLLDTNLKFCENLTNNFNLSFRVMKILLQMITTASLFDASKIFAVISKTNTRKTMTKLYPYEIGGLMFEIFYTNSSRFFEIVKLFYGEKARIKESVFQNLAKYMFPYVIVSGDKDKIASFVNKTNKSLKELDNEYFPDIAEYILICLNSTERIRAISVFGKITGTKFGTRYRYLKSKVASRIQFATCHPVQAKAERAETIILLLEGKKNSPNEPHDKLVKKYWKRHFILTLFYAARMFKKNEVLMQKAGIHVITYALQYIMDDIQEFMPDIITSLNIAAATKELEHECVLFWKDFFSRDIPGDVIRNTFVQIVYHLLCLFNKYEDEVAEIFHILIIDYKELTKDHFKKIAYFSPFNKPCLLAVRDTMKEYVDDLDWSQRVMYLTDQLNNVNSTLRKLILGEVFDLLKSHEDELYQNKLDIGKLTNKIWSIAAHENNNDNVILFGRVMALLPFSSESKVKDQGFIDKSNVDDIMIYIISEFLVKANKETPNAKFAIQQLLMYLGCQISDSDDSEENLSERGKKNWNRFSNKIKSVIETYRRPSYNNNTPKVADDYCIRNIVNMQNKKIQLFNKWIKTLFINLMENVPSVKEGDFEKMKLDGGYLESCSAAVAASPALGKFLISYAIAYNCDNKSFMDVIRREWNDAFQFLENSDRSIQNDGRTVIQWFFSLFETLNKMMISESKDVILKDWKYLEIANEFDLAKAALRCQLWSCAVYHLDNVYRYKSKDTSQENINLLHTMMRDAYKYAGDADTYQYLKVKLSGGNEFKDEFASSEITMMDDRETRNKKIELVSCMTSMGRFERALNDSKSLRTAFRGDLKLDSSITMCAIALGKWEECDMIINDNELKLSYEFDESKHCIEAPTMRFDISIGKYLCNLQYSSIKQCEEKICDQRKKLIHELQDAFLGTYDILCPVLVKVRMIDELEEFSKIYYNESTDYSFDKMKKWIDQEPINIEQLSRATCIRCGMINLMFNKDQNKMNQELAKEWISLSRACRKIDSLLAAEMHSTRAKKITNGDFDMKCILELAKIAWARNPSDDAVRLLDSTAKTPEMVAKISFYRAKFLDQLNSLDADGISKLYEEATKSEETAGKAYYMLATLIDHRIENYITYVESDGQEVSVSGKLTRMGSQKFWGSTSSSMNIAQFIKCRIPQALKNYFLAIINRPQYATEVVPRILSLFFDNCRILLMKDPPRPYSLISENQKPTIIIKIQETMKEFVPKVDPSIWFNSITQLISRVEQSEELTPYLFELLTLAVSSYPESALWHLMYVNHSQVELRRYKFDKIWDMIIEKNKDQAEKFEELQKKFTSITTDLIAMTTQPYKTKTATDVKAAEICPDLVEHIQNSGITIPITRAFKANTAEGTPRVAMMDDNIHIFCSQQWPKQITLLSETGDKIRFLCKKDEDLRKDMRMMEFASFVNTILDRDHRCKSRMISMTVFSVVCLDERCAMIEWVEHTTCFRHIVMDLYEAHNLGLPQKEITELMSVDIKMPIKRRIYNFEHKILPHFPPISNHWFANRFRNTSKWFKAQTIFTRSTAVWSMVGYIVGLGDRHTENILFNEETGAALHVDFCLMFDKAKNLAVPECVPFRLTQNIVAGMGALGVDGAFSSSCCLIMSALREKATKIVTMLQTFVQDPLLEWKKMSKDCEEIAAKQTLKEIERRVIGSSEDRSKIHSTEYFVKDLIQQATDNTNLAKMFYGWQPYL